MAEEYYINEQFGRVYQGQMALTDRVATDQEVSDYFARRQHETVMDMTVSVFQARAAMILAKDQGIVDYDLLDRVQGLIDASDDRVLKQAWDYATEWKRTSPTLAAVAYALKLTDDQMDRLFLLAASIEA